MAIIGGGLTGVSTAMHFAERFPELSVALLEAHELGAGASGRNAGQVLHGLAAERPEHESLALEIYNATELGIQLAEAWSLRFAPAGTFSRCGSISLQTTEKAAEEAHAAVESERELGVPMCFVPASALHMPGFAGGVLDTRAGVLNAWSLLQSLRPVLIDRGVSVYEHTPVLRTRIGHSHALETPRAELRARTLVLATNADTPALGRHGEGLLTLYAHALATPPLPDSVWSELGFVDFGGLSDDLTRIAYATRTPDGRLLFGGGSNAAYSYARARRVTDPARVRLLTERALGPMREVLHRYMPELEAVPTSHLWSGKLAIPVDRICSMGVSGEHRNVYHALGYSGHGVALALLAGRVLTDLYAGEDHHWESLPFYQRRLRRWPPEPLRRLGYEVYTRMTGRTPRSR